MSYTLTTRENYEDFSSGRFIYHKSGLPTFPVRLAQEVFLRSVQYLPQNIAIDLYDPMCGEAYLLTVLGLLNQGTISSIVGSDIHHEALEFANKNLALLSKSGLENRAKELEKTYKNFGKTSHLDAMSSAERFLKSYQKDIPFNLFHANVFDPVPLKEENMKANVLITDLPYDKMVSMEMQDAVDPDRWLSNLRPALTDDAIIAIISSKAQKLNFSGFQRVEKFQIGKRKIELWKP